MKKQTARAKQCKKISKKRASRHKRQIISRRVVLGFWSGSLLALTLAIGWGWQSGGIAQVYNRITDSAWRQTATAGFELQHVYLSGHDKVTRQMVLAKLPLEIGQPIMRLSLSEMQALLEEIPLVQKAEVSRSLPGSLHIRLTERTPIALWQRDGRLMPVDREGVVLQEKVDNEQHHLPMIVGTDANQQVEKLLVMMESAPELVRQLDAAIWVSNRRWDVQLKNGMKVKLPEREAATAWSRLDRLIAEHALLQKPIKVIDMRLPDRLFVEKMDQPALAATDQI